MDMPPGWTPQPEPTVDPHLKTDLSDIKELLTMQRQNGLGELIMRIIRIAQR